MTGETAINIERLRDFAALGLDLGEAAAELDLCCEYARRLARGAGIQLSIPAQANPKNKTARSLQMEAMYKNGYTLKQIGDQFGITRERVRQILTYQIGVTAKDGGSAKRTEKRRLAFEAKRNAACLNRWGCSWDQYVGLRSLKKPTRAFSSQRNNAKKRGIPFNLTLGQWWAIWQQSGHWSERGRGQGYVMCRVGDMGGYEVGNVFIALAIENNSNQPRKKSDLPIGVRENKRYAGYSATRCYGGKRYALGSFQSAQLAHAAYLAFVPPQQSEAA